MTVADPTSRSGLGSEDRGHSLGASSSIVGPVFADSRGWTCLTWLDLSSILGLRLCAGQVAVIVITAGGRKTRDNR